MAHQAPPGIQITRWTSGLHTNRSPLSTPFRSTLGGSIVFHDTLIDGSNMEITPQNTLARRPGWTKYCSVTYGADIPKAIAGCNLNGTIYTLLDTDQKIYNFTSSALTSIYTKTTTAQTFFQQVGLRLFISDGAVNQKWDGVLVTNNGVATPTLAPTISNLNLYDTVGASQTLHAWVPKYTYSNTTGSAQNYFFLAPTNEVQWAVVPAGSKLVSQSSAPNWATNYGVFGTTTVDGSISWINCGSITSWAATTIFTNGAFYLNKTLKSSANVATFTTSGSVSPATANWDVTETARAKCFGGGGSAPGTSNTLVATALGLSVPAGATVTGVVVTLYKGSDRINQISDVTVKLMKAGVAVGTNKALGGFWPFTNNQNAYPTVAQTTPYLYGSNKDLWGTTLTPTDVANAGFGFELIAKLVAGPNYSSGACDLSSLQCVVDVYYTVALSDIAGTVYAQIIADSNGNLQRVKTAGTSAGSAPTWGTTIGGTTTDGTITWECLGTANKLPVLFNWTYAYGFHTESGHISTMSPILQVTAPMIGPNVNIKGFGSDDTQVDRDDLYRTADGGSLLLFNQSLPNVNSTTQWSVVDSALDSDLNELIIGPVAHASDPPPAGMTILAYHMGRVWGVVGNLLYFSGGPDTINGDGMQAWPPANVFTFAAPIQGTAAASQGLVVYTGLDVSIVLGGPQALTFWVQPLLKNLGVQSPNCLAQDGDDMVLFSSSQQLIGLSPSGRREPGLDVAPTLATNFAASSSYIAVHRAGQDQGLFISDGTSKILRYNMNAQAWDVIGTAANGIGPLASVDTAIGTRRLLSTAGGYIVFRDVNTFSDAGTTYSAFATVGSLVMSPAGEPATNINKLVIVSTHVGTALSVGVLPNEVSGSFTNIPFTNADPWQLPASSTIDMKEYKWLGVQSPLPNIVKHVQVKITLPSEAFKNEIYSLSVI